MEKEILNNRVISSSRKYLSGTHQIRIICVTRSAFTVVVTFTWKRGTGILISTHYSHFCVILLSEFLNILCHFFICPDPQHYRNAVPICYCPCPKENITSPQKSYLCLTEIQWNTYKLTPNSDLFLKNPL